MMLATLMLAAVVNGGFENGAGETFPGWQDLQGRQPGTFPSLVEMRAMCWQMIAAGANGLGGFAFNMMIKSPGTVPGGGRQVTHKRLRSGTESAPYRSGRIR